MLVGKAAYFYVNNCRMKNLVLSLLLSPYLVFAQKSTNEVLNAEKSFAAYSVQNGTKAAFLKFADSNGVVFEEGKAVNAIETWRKRDDRPGVLNWRPIYGFVAASGELGFTTGPWTYQPKTIQDSIVARGEYSTVWRKTANGEWKFLLDMGIGNTPNFDSTSFSFNDEEIPFTPGNLANLQEAEERFVQATKESSERIKYYTVVVSRHAFLLTRNGRLPTTVVADIETLMNTMPQTIAYKQMGLGLSKSGDLGYVYGSATVNGKEESYLRIWRREAAAWKLVLEVLRY